MITRTSMPQSIGTILDGMKRNALQAVRQTMQENRLQSVPMGVDVRMGWTDENGRTRCGTVTGLSLEGEQLKVQLAGRSMPFVLDEQQLSCGCHIWLKQLNDAVQNTLERKHLGTAKAYSLTYEWMGCRPVSHHHTCRPSFYKPFLTPVFILFHFSSGAFQFHSCILQYTEDGAAASEAAGFPNILNGVAAFVHVCHQFLPFHPTVCCL